MSERLESPKPPIARVWAVITGALAFLAVLAKALESLPKLFLTSRDLWMAHFMWDCLMGALLLGLVPLLLIEWRINLPTSIWRVIRFGAAWQAAVVATLCLAMAFLSFPIWREVRPFYRVRYDQTQIDWHLVAAKAAMLGRNYSLALREFKLSDKEQQANFENDIEECNRRINDAQTLIARFTRESAAASSVNMEHLLMLQRAANLDPYAAGLAAAILKAQAIINKGLESYLQGVRFVKNRHLDQARTAFAATGNLFRGIFPSDELMAIINEATTNLSADQNSLLELYLHTPDAALERLIRSHPTFVFFSQQVAIGKRVPLPQLFKDPPNSRSDLY